MSSVLVVDAANVVGSSPDGWWKDRAGAPRRLHEEVVRAGPAYDEVVLVLEGAATRGLAAGTDGHVRTVHAPRDGDDEIVGQASAAVGLGYRTTVVTADRGLRARVERLGALVLSPSWLLDQL